MTRSSVRIPHRGNRLKDEVYRQMFLLEEGRPGADIGLALALLRAWAVTNTKSEAGDPHDWLQKVSPICIQMIESFSRRQDSLRRCSP